MNTGGKWLLLASAGLTLALLGTKVASPQQLDEYGQQIAQTVARVSIVQGSVSYARGDDSDNWQAADVNIPVTLGDHLYTDQQSRAELQVHGGDVVRLGARTDLTALNLTDDTRQFAVKLGVATFEIRRLDQNEVWEVDTPNSAVTLEEPGRYTVQVDQDGNSRVSVARGAASVAAGGGQVPVNAGQVMKIDGIDSPRYDVESIAGIDGWDQWNQQREDRLVHSRSSQYVSQDIVGGDDLDQYGQWQQVPNYGWAWSPGSVEAGWVPYSVGHWGWQDPWGWTWISSEPWGWAPYHYGRWVNDSSRWFWVPVGPSVQVVAYSPALVAFVGGGPGFSASAGIGGGGFVGWFPLGPRDPLNAWWLPQRESVNVTNVTYINKTYVTVVNQNTFVTGGVVANNIVRDRGVVQQMAAAPVVRGAVPVIPTAASTRISLRTASAARPPAAAVSRAVVVRVAPPPAPPRFDQKLAVIRQNGGAPVAPKAAAQLTVQQGSQTRGATEVRSAVASSGGVTLAPARPSAAAASHVQPVSPVKGRPLAPADHPVSTDARAPAAERPAQPAQEARPGTEARPFTPPPATAPGQPPREQPVHQPVAVEPSVHLTPPGPGREAAPEHGRIATPPNERDRRQPTPARTLAEPANRPPAGRVQGERPLPTPADRSREVTVREARPESTPREHAQAGPPPSGRQQPEEQRPQPNANPEKEKQRQKTPKPTPRPE